MLYFGICIADSGGEKQRESALAHDLLRKMLTENAVFLPCDAKIRKDENGRPFYAVPDASAGFSRLSYIDFNLSHAKDPDGRPVAVCAVSVVPFGREAPRVGVDIEFPRAHLPYLRLAERYFTDGEQAFLKEASDPVSAFLTVWTRKEAVLKFRGTGLAGGMRTCDSAQPASLSDRVRLCSCPVPASLFPTKDSPCGMIALCLSAASPSSGMPELVRY